MCVGAMYRKLPDEVDAGTYNRVASLWFVAMVVIFQAGMAPSCTFLLLFLSLLCRRDMAPGQIITCAMLRHCNLMYTGDSNLIYFRVP